MTGEGNSSGGLPPLQLGQEKVKAVLDSFLSGSVPSLLFSGPEGVGKEYTAIDFARKLCCRRDPACSLLAELCPSCRQAAALAHPGIHLVYPTPSQGGREAEDGDAGDLAKIIEQKRRDIFAVPVFSKKVSIRVARARAIVRRAHTKPFGGLYNIFIVVDAHTMREEAQNALLKLLEEPPEKCILIFITTNLDALLYTVRSRLQKLRFSPLSPEVIKKILTDHYGLDASTASRAARLARGSVKKALDIASSCDDSLASEALEIITGLPGAADHWLIARARKLAQGGNRDRIALFLHELSLYFRDMMCADPTLYHDPEKSDHVVEMANSWQIGRIPGIIDRITTTRQNILMRNANMEASLAHLLLDIRHGG